MGKQLVSFVTFGCKSMHPFCNLQSRARTHAVLVIGLYELLGNTKSGRHDIADILLKVALKHQQSNHSPPV
jgi:hypothetical protein